MNEWQRKRIEAHKTAIAEAKRFIKKAEAAIVDYQGESYFNGTPATAAAKRASMDLTRSLAELRRS